MNARVNVKPHTGHISFTAILSSEDGFFLPACAERTHWSMGAISCACVHMSEIANKIDACRGKEYKLAPLSSIRSKLEQRLIPPWNLLWSMFWDCNDSDSGFGSFPLRSLYL